MLRPRVMPSWCARLCVAAVLVAPALAGCTSAGPPPVDTPALEVVLRYKLAPVRLRQDVVFSMQTEAAGTTSKMEVALTGVLDVNPVGSKFKVDHSVAEVQRVEMDASLLPKPAPGEPPVDVKAGIAAGRGAKIVGVRGEVDEAATKTLPEPDTSEYAGLAGSVLGLPELPEVALVPGVPAQVESRKTDELLGSPFELEITTTYTLLEVVEQDGARIATVAFTSTGTGAREGGAPVVVAMEAVHEGKIVFDVGAQLPLRSEVTGKHSIQFGVTDSAVLLVQVESTYAPG